MAEDVDGLLREAVISGTPAAIDALVATGDAAVRCFHDVVRGRRKIDLPSGRGAIDGLSQVAHELGRRLPHDFFATFATEKHSFAMIGLGASGLPEAQPILARVARSRRHWTSRIDAVMGLRNLPGPAAVEALISATRSRQYLVRYHAVDSLGVIGDSSALPRLRELAAKRKDPAVADQAARALEMMADRGVV